MTIKEAAEHFRWRDRTIWAEDKHSTIQVIQERQIAFEPTDDFTPIEEEFFLQAIYIAMMRRLSEEASHQIISKVQEGANFPKTISLTWK